MSDRYKQELANALAVLRMSHPSDNGLVTRLIKFIAPLGREQHYKAFKTVEHSVRVLEPEYIVEVVLSEANYHAKSCLLSAIVMYPEQTVIDLLIASDDEDVSRKMRWGEKRAKNHKDVLDGGYWNPSFKR